MSSVHNPGFFVHSNVSSFVHDPGFVYNSKKVNYVSTSYKQRIFSAVLSMLSTNPQYSKNKNIFINKYSFLCIRQCLNNSLILFSGYNSIRKMLLRITFFRHIKKRLHLTRAPKSGMNVAKHKNLPKNVLKR